MRLFSKKVAAKSMAVHFKTLGSTLHLDLPVNDGGPWTVRLVQGGLMGTGLSPRTLKTWMAMHERGALQKFSEVETTLHILEAIDGRRVQ